MLSNSNKFFDTELTISSGRMEIIRRMDNIKNFRRTMNIYKNSLKPPMSDWWIVIRSKPKSIPSIRAMAYSILFYCHPHWEIASYRHFDIGCCAARNVRPSDVNTHRLARPATRQTGATIDLVLSRNGVYVPTKNGSNVLNQPQLMAPRFIEISNWTESLL